MAAPAVPGAAPALPPAVLRDRHAYAAAVCGPAPAPPPAAPLPAAAAERRQRFLAHAGGRYGLGGRLAALRETEFARLQDVAYLDQAGTGLYSATQIREAAELMTTNVFGNPHSVSSCSTKTQEAVEQARAAALEFFGTDDDDHDVVFTANATAGLKLVGESFPWGPGSVFLHLAGNHTSVLGLRQYALARGGRVVALRDEELGRLLRDPQPYLRAWAADTDAGGDAPAACLFAFPAEDNFHGRLYPLELAGHVKAALGSQWRVLADAACFAATAPLDVRDCEADFVVVSFAKLLGYPQVGGLLIRRPAGYALARPYFGGGAIVECAATTTWHMWRELPARFEDGTPAFLGLLSLAPGLRWMRDVGMAAVEAHTTALSEWLALALASLRHGNGRPVCLLHGHHFGAAALQGPIVTFNVVRPDGSFVRLTEVAAHLNDAQVQVRAGSLCNAGSCHSALGIPEELVVQRETMDGCGWDDLVDGKPLGAVRASVGYFNTWEDVDRLYCVIRDRFQR